MLNKLVLIFKKDDMQKLMDHNPDKIVVRSTIEEATLNSGEKAGVVRVYADAMQGGNPEPLTTIRGCPNPPCNVDDGN
jgi:hypothetical protein